MEWADDIAYSIGDVVDAFKARFITIEKLRAWKGKSHHEPTFSKLLKILEQQDIDRFSAHEIGHCIEACSLVVRAKSPSPPPTNRHRFDLHVREVRRRELKRLQAIATDMVFKSPAVQQLEFKAKRVLETLFQTL